MIFSHTFCDILPPKRSIFFVTTCPPMKDYLVHYLRCKRTDITDCLEIMKVALIKKVKKFLDYISFISTSLMSSYVLFLQDESLWPFKVQIRLEYLACGSIYMEWHEKDCWFIESIASISFACLLLPNRCLVEHLEKNS